MEIGKNFLADIERLYGYVAICHFGPTVCPLHIVAEHFSRFNFVVLFDIRYLVQLKKLPNTASFEDERTSATLKLLEYLDSSGKSELYNRYIHDLALLHRGLKNNTEVGLLGPGREC